MSLTNRDLRIILKEGEGLTVEFKQQYSSRIDRDIVAFSNTKGGIIVLGVSDKGKMVGEKLTNKLKAQINDLARNCEPAITIKKISQIDKIAAIEIEEGSEKPYSCSDGYFRRLDAVTQKMNQREVRLIFREADNVSFESLACKSFGLNDISLKKVKSFLKEAGTSFKVSKANLESFLTSLGLYQQKKINNVGALMFASKIARYIPYSEIILVAFKGKDKRNIYDRKDVRDDLLAQLNEAVTFVKKHLNVRSEIRDINRHDIYEIPLDALREALVNALVHRDYSMSGTSLYVEVYDDRVVIVNPGGLPSGITKANFGKESIRRNLIVADLFHRMGKVERIGSGISTMIGLMREAGLKKPIFESENFFRATFCRDSRYSLKQDFQKKIDQKGDEKSTEKMRRKYGENAGKVFESISKDAFIKTKDIADKIDLSQSAVEKIIRKLKKASVLKRIGPDKGGYWKVVK
ncbi:MAG: putative DNA binding domain-containing protein [Desulfobacteraceae bacterium]|nr:putative DNA binding domain-containing protein [Desulfobacteraceae bacterium]